MLDIRKVESINNVYISGVLNDLDIITGTSTDGKDYVRGTARIRVDQEINGKVVENIIPVSMYANRLKKDGSTNSNYERIVGYKTSLTSIAAAESPDQASKVTIGSLDKDIATFQENSYYNKEGKLVQAFQISTNFINTKRESDEEGAKFKISGVVGKMKEEVKDDEPTGRLIITFVVIGYNGRANVLELIAEGNAKSFIETNWNEGDTVQVTGVVNMSYSVKVFYEEQGFGEPIKRTQTESRRELIITGGSPNGFEEALAYDADDVKTVLAERQARLKEIEAKSQAKAANTKAPSNGFSF